jgi:hypothetical protein
MKNKQYMITLMIILVNFIFGCSKAQEDEKINLKNVKIDTSQNYIIDFDNDQYTDFGIRYVKNENKESIFTSLSFIVPNDYPYNHDVLLDNESVNNLKLVKICKFGDTINFSKQWSLLSDSLSGYCGHYEYYKNFKENTESIIGHSNFGQVYIPFKFYSLTFKEGWYYGWIKINIQKMNIEILSYAISKNPNSFIVCGLE